MMDFQVGYYEFSKDEGLNFQLNRFYSSGFLGYEELCEIGKKVTSFEVWIKLFTELAEEAEAQGNVQKSSICYRAAQFYTLGNAKDEKGQLLKHVLYEKCMTAYDRLYGAVEGLHYRRISYKEGYLPVFYMEQEGQTKGDIVIHGGYDSFVQEFMGVLLYLHKLGYSVYFFEGPGQGEVLHRCDIHMTHEWEHCVSAVLDDFGLEDVTLIGISLGGYLATRAAAFEPRVKRLVMYDLIYDFYGSLKTKTGKTKGKLLDYLTEHPRSFLWKMAECKLNKIYFSKWLLQQGYAIYENVNTPYEYFNCIKKYNTIDISEKITQDTLVLAGTSDMYTVFYQEQLDALTNAHSVTGRLFTEKESADHHCQIGNLQLVLDVIANWIEEKTNA